MTRSFVITIAIALLSAAGSVLGQGAFVIYDPAAKAAEIDPVSADERLVREKLVPKAVAHWEASESCNGGELNIIGALDGSFTRPGSLQRVIVYELCQTGNGFANNGIGVFESGRVVAHFVEEGGWNLEISKAPDLNRNGRAELIIETGGGMHQGYTGSSVTIIEIGDSEIVSLGTYLAYTNECENLAPGKYCDRSYKLTASPGPVPAISAQKFLNRGTESRPKWVASGKAFAAKPIPDTAVKFTLLK
ncbi:MAG TPA: hypothetical protein PKD26_11110 [Pyrinomonadaceae bacterium]|nr:hypothetical protein [Pyrinomonadaceae bacterium]